MEYHQIHGSPGIPPTPPSSKFGGPSKRSLASVSPPPHAQKVYRSKTKASVAPRRRREKEESTEFSGRNHLSSSILGESSKQSSRAPRRAHTGIYSDEEDDDDDDIAESEEFKGGASASSKRSTLKQVADHVVTPSFKSRQLTKKYPRHNQLRSRPPSITSSPDPLNSPLPPLVLATPPSSPPPPLVTRPRTLRSPRSSPKRKREAKTSKKKNPKKNEEEEVIDRAQFDVVIEALTAQKEAGVGRHDGEMDFEAHGSSDNDEGTVFFAELDQMAQDGKLHSWDELQAQKETFDLIADMESLSAKTITPLDELDLLSPETEAIDGLSPKDRAYCHDFVDPKTKCDFCRENMPLAPSDDLLSLRVQLSGAAARSNNSSLNWTQTLEYCSLHRAETTTIPLGQKRGYLMDIDFCLVVKRLEKTKWLREELEKLCNTPSNSSFFQLRVKQIASGGIQGLESAKTLNLSMPGYYGILGKAVIMRHYQNLQSWGLLPGLRKTNISPLSPSEFIAHVLVPETGIALIMADQGWEGEFSEDAPEWTQARRKAYTTWKESNDFGRWKYRDTGPEAEQVLKKVRKMDRHIRQMAERERARGQGRSREVIDVTSDS